MAAWQTITAASLRSLPTSTSLNNNLQEVVGVDQQEQDQQQDQLEQQQLVSVSVLEEDLGKKERRRIDYALRPKKFLSDADLIALNRSKTCHDDRDQLSDDLQQVFNFDTDIRTNLNILIIGDSVGMQLGSQFLRATRYDMQQQQQQQQHPDYTTLAWRENIGPGVEGLIAAAPVQGGGSVGVWRMLNLFRKGLEGLPQPNQGPGWTRLDVYDYLNHTQQRRHRQTTRTTTPRTNTTSSPTRMAGSGFEAVDVVFQRISHPWVQPKDITNETLAITLNEDSNWFVAAETFIFVTAHFNSNIMTMKDLEELRSMNERVRSFVESFSPTTADSTVKTVLLADVGRLMDELIVHNGKQLGFNTTTDDYMLVPLGETQGRHRQYSQKIAQTCSSQIVYNGTKAAAVGCRKNALLFDGMHLCMETIGGRIDAGFACLIDCAYHRPEEDESLRACEKRCNDKFMSLRRVPSNEIKTIR